jgi:hypothetical protein
MQADEKQASEIKTLNTIRVETALSRYPVHRLARKGEIRIDVLEGSRENALRWKVSHNSEYGQPGPLAYKLDTLIINRRIEEAIRPIHRLIKLGSLHDICKELGVSEGKNKSTIKQALYQNASAFITAKIHYKSADGGERILESGFTRYSVIFTGEKLPSGHKADGVYILLNDVFIQVINGAMTRPLDYEYLKSLPPAPQRFYELLSYQMYAALKFDRPRAKLIYSEFCDHAPQMRHEKWDKVRSQMGKLHRPHRESGYIDEVDFQQTADREGKIDWIMFYKPGNKARADFKTFNKRGGPSIVEIEPLSPQPILSLLPPGPSPLEAALIGHGISRATAAAMAGQYDAERIAVQIEVLEWMESKKPGKITDPAAWLVIAIKNNHAKPKGFVTKAERERRAEAKRLAEQQAMEDSQQKRKADHAERQLTEQVKAYQGSRTAAQLAQLKADAIAQASEETRQSLEAPHMAKFREAQNTVLIREHITRLIQSGQLVVDPA